MATFKLIIKLKARYYKYLRPQLIFEDRFKSNAALLHTAWRKNRAISKADRADRDENYLHIIYTDTNQGQDFMNVNNNIWCNLKRSMAPKPQSNFL